MGFACKNPLVCGNNMMNETGIYTIINAVNNKRYVGQAVNIKNRIAGHFKRLNAGKHHCAHLQNAFIKYGRESFICLVLENCKKEMLTEREQYWMDYYKYHGLYNTAPAAGSNIGIKFSAKVRAKMAEKLTGRPVSEETRAKMSMTRMGWSPSNETKAKMSAAKRMMSDETKKKMSEAHKGVKLSAAHKESIRKGHAGRPHAGHILTKEDCAKGGKKNIGNNWNLGRVASLETRAKISKALKGRKMCPAVVAKAVATRWGREQQKPCPLNTDGQI